MEKELKVGLKEAPVVGEISSTGDGKLPSFDVYKKIRGYKLTL